MPRLALPAIALSVLAAACGPQVPPGSALAQVEVRNSSPDGVQLVIQTETGESPDAVQPAALAPGSAADVTLAFPTDEQWWLVVRGPNRDGNFESQIDGSSIQGLLGQSCTVVINLRANQGTDIACVAAR